MVHWSSWYNFLGLWSSKIRCWTRNRSNFRSIERTWIPSKTSLKIIIFFILILIFKPIQTRIILNKADTVKPEELMRVQSALIWNISPLMSSAQPPVMYTTSLWSHPYESGSPARLLQAQERSFLRDLRTAIDKRIENKIASARRFAVSIYHSPHIYLIIFNFFLLSGTCS